jgi:MFS family permease
MPMIDPDIALPIPPCCQRSRGSDSAAAGTVRVNHNVFLNLVVAVLYGISSSLWNGTAYAAYLKKLGDGKNGPLGDIEAVSGLASLLTALPIGYIADKIGRSKVIRAGGILLLITSILQIGVLEWVGTNDDGSNIARTTTSNYDGNDYEGGGVSGVPRPDSFWSSWIVGGNYNDHDSGMLSTHGTGHSTGAALWMCGIIMALWGVGDGVVNGPCMALFADSTPEGHRSDYFTYMFVAFTAASACGPLVSIILFQTLGDDWDLYHLRIVIYVGLVIEIVSSLVMMFFDDRKALDESNNDDSGMDEDDDGMEAGDVAETVRPDAAEDVGGTDSSGGGGTTDGANDAFSDEGPDGGETSPTSSSSSGVAARRQLRKRQKWVPYIVFSQGLIFAMGSGMTVKFFPLFFKDEVGMSPSQVQVIYVIVPFVMVFASTLCTRLAGPIGFGRVQSMLVFSCLGISMLYAMVFFKSYLDHHPFLLVPVYVLRTSLMNASYPIQESILMDFVPKEERARWKSLDSVASFGWCGSAALGGWLADKFDYTYTFLITAVLQTIGTLVWCLLLPLVPRQEGNREDDDDDDDGGQTPSNHDGPSLAEDGPNGTASSMTQPLLAMDDSDRR